jgi:hypothetical protein
MECAVSDEIERRGVEAKRQLDELAALFDHHGDAALRWRPEPNRWSIAEHVAHLGLTNRPYLDAIDEAIERARASGLLGSGPFRYGWLGNRFVRSMEPPPGFRIRTFKRLVPSLDRAAADALVGFEVAQRRLMESLERAEGVDLGRAKIRSPFFKLLKLSVGQAFDVILAHNRRHVWHVDRVLSHPEFPDPSAP